MDTKGNSLDEISERLVDAILADNILQRDHLIKRTRAILQAWVRTNDRPADYNSIKTDKGVLQRTIEQEKVEKEYWRSRLRLFTADMQAYYDELKQILKERGF